MQNCSKLTELIEQAACSINTLSPADLSEMDGLQKTFDRIKQSIDEITEAPSELLAQAKDATDDAHETLQKILHKEVEDTTASINAVSGAIQSLQTLCGQLIETESPEEPGPEQTTEAQTESQDVTCIADDDLSLVLDFIVESSEHLEAAEASVLELENKPDDEETLNQIFRAFHTIKGTAGFLNVTEVSSLAHVAENLLNMARKGELVMTGENTDAIFESMDMLKKMMAVLKDSAETGKPVPSQGNLPVLAAKL